MKKIKPDIALYFIALITSILLFILVIVYIKLPSNKNIETFDAGFGAGQGEILYDTVNEISNIAPTPVSDDDDGMKNKINHDSNFYNIDTGGSNFKLPANFGATNMCIYKDATTGSDAEMECLTAGELGIFKKLPLFRKEHVCIDEECIGLEEIKRLNGSTNFRLAHTNNDSTEDKYVSTGLMNDLVTCDGTTIEGWNVLKTEAKGGDNGYFNFRYSFPSGIDKLNLRLSEEDQIGTGISYSESGSSETRQKIIAKH
jgi:hypothetical protein